MTLLLSLFFIRLEGHTDHHAEAVLVGRGKLVVIETAYVFDMEEFEDIMDTKCQLHIRTLGIDNIGTLREIHQNRIADIGGILRIVLVGEFTPKYAETYPLTPLEFLEQGNAVEDLSVQIPVYNSTEETVSGELHIVNRLESIVLYYIRKVGLRHDEQREGNFLPLDAALDEPVHLTPRTKPEALVDAGLSIVVAIVATQEILETDRMACCKHRRIKVDGHSTLLGVDERLAWGEA